MHRHLQLHLLVIRRRHPQRQPAAVHQIHGPKLQDIQQHSRKAIRLLRRDIMALQMRRFTVDPMDFLLLLPPVFAPQDLQAFADAVGRIADDAVQDPGGPQGRMRQIGDEAVEVPVHEMVLLEIGEGVDAVFAADGAAVDVGAHGHGAEMGAGDGETARAGEGVVEEFPGVGVGEIGGYEGEFGIHGGGA